MNKIVIADVLCTVTDETFYVLNKLHENASKYYSDTLDDVFNKLKADGWEKCGKVYKDDNSFVDMLTNHKEYISVWEE